MRTPDAGPGRSRPRAALNALFPTAPVGPGTWLRAGAVALAALAVVESEKWLRARGRPAPAD